MAYSDGSQGGATTTPFGGAVGVNSSGISFAQFFYGISQQESGGNYGAVNPNTGALGKYQIMPANIPAWSREFLGVSWTPQQFLADPTKQDALAQAVLKSYYDKWGARGAAAAWYSGHADLNMDYSPQKYGPSIGEYVDQVLAHGLKMPGSTGVPGAGNEYVPTIINDQTKQSPQQPLPGNDSGMAAVSSPVSGPAVTSAMDAFDGSMSGAQAVGPGGEQAGFQPSDTLPDGHGPLTPSNLAGMGSKARQMAIQAALRWLGAPYVWGGGGAGGPTRSAIAHGNFSDVGFDCSGLVQYALAAAGLHVPRLSYDQLAIGQKSPIASLQPGDLVGFGDGSHIAIWMGNGQIIEAPHTGTSVRERALQPGEDAWGVSLNNLYK